MKKLDIIYEDKELLVVNKPTRLLCISDGKTDYTLYAMAREYVKKQHKSNKIFIVHRLDRETSGIVLFAKKEDVKKTLQSKWNQITKREYIAIVEGHMLNKKGVIKEYLLEDKTHRVYASHKQFGEYAETSYEVINENKKTSTLRCIIKTGKKNQIRVGLSNLGHPIVGDKKYGSKTNYFKRMALHASRLELKFNNKTYEFISEVPKELKIN